jgi:hypothetical protein
MAFPINSSLSAVASGFVNLTTSQFPGFNINIVLTNTFTGSGTLYVKYINQFADTGATSAAWNSIPVVSGAFLNGLTTYTLLSGSVPCAPYLQLSWVKSGTVTGTFLIQGQNI